MGNKSSAEKGKTSVKPIIELTVEERTFLQTYDPNDIIEVKI